MSRIIADSVMLITAALVFRPYLPAGEEESEVLT
jgi:hypothetical protein